MERVLMDELCRWKNKTDRKPLIIRGARQVGKTWLMKEFGNRYFEKVAYISFDNNELMKNVFEMDFDIKRIISALEIACGEKIDSQNTLLIFDEVQEVPKALTSLKYFYENAPEYAIVAAGSLLGVALHEGTSFPVGKVDFIDLYPMNFEEFLNACGEERLSKLLGSLDFGMINTFASKYKDLLRKYYYVGGMPEVVKNYIEKNDMKEVRELQKRLLLYYANDFSKHAPRAAVPRIQMVWDSIPMQLAKENRKFIYGAIREGARAKDFELAIRWLIDCGLIYITNRVKKIGMPLIAYMDMSSFKIFMLDIGLLGARGDIDAKTILEGDKIFQEFKGALTEQFVAQELSAAGIDLYYYSAENSKGEVDFVIQKNGEIIPIEVKAEENLQSKSLKNAKAKFQLDFAVRTSMSNYREQDWMTNVPLYLIGSYL